MSEEKSSSSDKDAWAEQERFTLESGRRMTLRNRLLWLEEMHLLVLRWSEKRRMMYSDGTIIGPGSSSDLPAIAEPPADYGASTGGEPGGQR